MPTPDTLGWLGELIAETCAAPPVLVGYALGGAIAARFAAGHGDRIRGLVLVDALGLAAFDPAPEFGQALHAFLAQPDESTHDQLWKHCAFDLDGLRERMGERWEAFRTYNLDRARVPSSLMEEFGLAAIAPDELARIAVPVTLIWGRHDLATPLAVAEAAAAKHGWPLHVIEDCADDPPIEQPEALVRALEAEDLRERLDGPLLLPGGEGFDEATVLWNGMIAKTPAIVVQPSGTDDVVARRRVRPRARPAGLGPRRRPQHRRHGAGRRRRDDRHVAAAGRSSSTRSPAPPRSSPAACSATSTARRSATGWPRRSGSSPRSAWRA